MRLSPPLFACLLLFATSVTATGLQPQPIEPEKGEVYYTRHNFWHEKGVSFGTNYSAGDLVPLNSRVKVLSIGRRELILRVIDGERIILRNVPKYTKRTVKEIAANLLSPTPIPYDSLGEQKARDIRYGILSTGMSKDEVIMARGYPPQHKTPALEFDRWVYWSSRMVQRALLFEDGRLSKGRGVR